MKTDVKLFGNFIFECYKYYFKSVCFKSCNHCKLQDRSTGESLSEALNFASTNSQYDDRLFIELQVQYMKIPSSNQGRCVQKLFPTFRTIFVHNMFSPCSAKRTKRRASDKDLSVQPKQIGESLVVKQTICQLKQCWKILERPEELQPAMKLFPCQIINDFEIQCQMS